MRGLGMSGFVARLPELPFSKAAPEFRSVSKPYAVLFVGGSWEGRVWQARNFGEIGRRLRECGVNVVLAGGPLDRIQAAIALDCLNGNAIDLIEKTSLSELAELLRNAVVVLSNETSAVHIGAAVGTPVLCILGGGHFGRFLPYVVEKLEPSRPTPIVVVQRMSCFGCNWRCIHPQERGEAVKCISDISVEQVWRHLEEVLPAWTRVKERIGQDS
jgi:ADP-heptose:LPS heptosyltransferase